MVDGVDWTTFFYRDALVFIVLVHSSQTIFTSNWIQKEIRNYVHKQVIRIATG